MEQYIIKRDVVTFPMVEAFLWKMEGGVILETIGGFCIELIYP